MADVIDLFGGPPPRAAQAPPPFLVIDAAGDPQRLAAYGALRRRSFVDEQCLFARTDADHLDEHPQTRVLVAVSLDGSVLGGVRLHPEGAAADLGWWRGSRLVSDAGTGASRGSVGAALVRAACARALEEGVLRFDAYVQQCHASFFARLGWKALRDIKVAGACHILMHWPVQRIAELAAATKRPLGALLGTILPHNRWLGDDGAPLAGTDVVACTDAIVSTMVQRDPEWAGWCGMLVTAHDLAAMGARPVGALDAVGAGDAAHVEAILRGVRAGAEAFDLPIIGGHTQLGVPAALSVTGLGRTDAPVPAGGGRPGDVLTVTADVEGAWRPGYHGLQWDSSSWRTRDELRPMLNAVRDARPQAAKDVSAAGIVGTVGMLAEASGCGAELDVSQIARPIGALLGDWLTCFPGFAVVTADDADARPLRAGAAVGARCGRLTCEAGVRLRWPDGEITTALPGAVTGLGPSTYEDTR